MDNKGLEALAALASAAPASNSVRGDGGTGQGAGNAGQKRRTGVPAASVQRETAPDTLTVSDLATAVPSTELVNQLQANSISSQIRSLGGAAPQHWQQSVAAASAAGMNSGTVPTQNLPLLSGTQQLPHSNDPSVLVAMQNLAFYQMLSQNQQSAASNHQQRVQQQLQHLINQERGATANPADQSEAIARALAGHSNTSSILQQLDAASKQSSSSAPAPNAANLIQRGTSTVPDGSLSQSQISSSASSISSGPNAHASKSEKALSTATMPPPPPSTSVAATNAHLLALSSSGSTATGQGAITANLTNAIAPQPPMGGAAAVAAGMIDGPSLFEDPAGLYDAQIEDKKEQKRAANRKSAQLSRKRKKQFIEELKEENDDLRRKEQILKAIPDLIVVFDSSGKLVFVSQSVTRFMRFASEELEGTSFWDRLCEDSVRLLKAAFMDSLAAREKDSDTAPLGSGVWELRLVDKDGSQKLVALNGVVHFAGDRPECVCSIRPRNRKEGATSSGLHRKIDGAHKASISSSNSASASAVLSSSREDSSSSDSNSSDDQMLRVKPQQSVMSKGGGGTDSSCGDHGSNKRARSGIGGGKVPAPPVAAAAAAASGNMSIRISDSGNSSGESESGSSDENGTAS